MTLSREGMAGGGVFQNTYLTQINQTNFHFTSLKCIQFSLIHSYSPTDMKIYGYCPALDNFYLVVCSHCGRLVKPQAFEAHCERRHGALTKLQNPSSDLADQQRPQPGRLPSIPSSREGHKTGETQEAAGSSKTASAPQHRTTKLLTEDARYYTCLCHYNVVQHNV